MSTTILSDTLVVESQPAPAEVESAKCDCCGLTEECTTEYIEKVKERYNGRWVCGLCSEAVKTDQERLIVTREEALTNHINFCKKFAASPSETDDPALHLISAMRQILLRSLDSPPRGGMRSTPGSPTTKSVGKLSRSGSCFSTLSR